MELKTVEVISPVERIIKAVGEGQDLDKLRQLLNLQKEWEENEAKKIYFKEFASAQSEIGAVVKSKNNEQTHSKYADLSDVIDCAKPVYTRHGFAVIFYEGKSEYPEHVRICADVLHLSGHQKTYYLDIPLDGMGIKGNPNMTKIHGKASSTSYARRYLMCMIWNIPTADDDGNAAGITYINEWQVEELSNLIESKGFKLETALKYLKVESLDKIRENDYKKAEALIKAAVKVSR